MNTNPNTKQCNVCGEIKDLLTEFYTTSHPRMDGTIGYRNYCKACHVIQKAEYRARKRGAQ
jgi:nitrate/TMAO reductase-like tetraheme cytochrome c subunit